MESFDYKEAERKSATAIMNSLHVIGQWSPELEEKIARHRQSFGCLPLGEFFRDVVEARYSDSTTVQNDYSDWSNVQAPIWQSTPNASSIKTTTFSPSIN